MNPYLEDIRAIRPTLEEAYPRLAILKRRSGRYVDRLADIQQTARQAADVHIRPIALDLDRRIGEDPRYFDRSVLDFMMDNHYLSFMIPKAYGGQGCLATEMCILMEELCSACAGIANIIGAHHLGMAGLLMSLDLAVIDRIFPEIVAGEKRRQPVLLSAATLALFK